MKPKHALVLFCLSALMALPVVARAPGEFSPPSRTFLFTYQVTLKDLPAGAQRVRVWIPRAVTDSNQTVALKKVDGPVHLRETLEHPFGNHILYGEILHPPSGPAEFTVEYEVTRKEYSKGDYASSGEGRRWVDGRAQRSGAIPCARPPGSDRWKDQGTGG